MARKTPGSGSVIVMTALVTLIAGLAIMWPTVAYILPSTGSTGPDPVSIVDYQADFKVDEGGTLTAVERLDTLVPCCDRHGIFRWWPIDDPNDRTARLIPQDIEVTLDGQPEKFELSWNNGRKYRVAKIGRAERTLSPGRHVYEIRYTIKGALSPSNAGAKRGSASWAEEGDTSAFYWDVVGGGWQMSMDKTTSRVTLPTKADDIKCTYGFDSTGVCQVTGGGTDGITITTGPLGPRTPVTVRATQDIAPPGRVTLPWPAIYDGVLGHSLPLALFVGALAALGLVIGRLWEWRSREDPPGYPVSYEPPPGLGPVQSYFIMNEKVPSTALTSTLLYQAERGLTKLTQNGRDWVIEGTGGDWTKVDPVTRGLGEKLGITGVGATFHANGTVSAGQDLTSAQTALDSSTKSWALTSGLLAGTGSEMMGRALVVVAGVLTGVLIFWRPGGITLWAIPFAGFAIGGIGLLRRGVGTRRTPAGRDQWSRSGGFYRLLSTTSAQDRFDFSARKDLYTAYIPYAVAYDCADKWAKKYELSTGEQPPQPTWYSGPVSSGGFWGSSSSFAGFESSLRSSIGAYEASQSSSSSGGGGGGFSGGGGGGGGGGGSW